VEGEDVRVTRRGEDEDIGDVGADNGRFNIKETTSE
jgi:hypothetical protein